jgi:hypothetical protein
MKLFTLCIIIFCFVILSLHVGFLTSNETGAFDNFLEGAGKTFAAILFLAAVVASVYNPIKRVFAK